MRAVRDRCRNPAEEPSRWAEVMAASNIPPRYARASVDAIDPASGLNVRKWMEWALNVFQAWTGAGHGFYMEGPFGSGKSSCAGILAVEALLRCERVLWLPIRDVPAARFREDDRGKALNERLHSADFLVLDDLGAERFRIDGVAGVALEECFRIMYERERSVIITSNIAWSAFASAYDKNAPLVSIVQRMVTPVTISNPQWPKSPSGAA